ncbi:unnamed protein product [Paramecium sonneborni]|uniref:Uncharacterized protein n=1 Tax=Paramecium sonneborni TaxID=65129 RepID=A0A8S1R4S4_9CILI|nr:unnamed protein product [Paramecium sonneborni]
MKSSLCDPKQGKFPKNPRKANVTDSKNSNKKQSIYKLLTYIYILIQHIQLYSQLLGSILFLQINKVCFSTKCHDYSQNISLLFKLNKNSSSLQLITIEFLESNSLFLPHIDNCNQTFYKSNNDKIYDPYQFEIKKSFGCKTCEDTSDSQKILSQKPGAFCGYE